MEILHIILLGIIKYVWHALHTAISDTNRNLFVTRLQSTDIRGLSIPVIRASYISQYRKSLVGKHFKTLMQTMAFHAHGIVSDGHFELIKAAGRLGALIYYHEIPNLQEYLVLFYFLNAIFKY